MRGKPYAALLLVVAAVLVLLWQNCAPGFGILSSPNESANSHPTDGNDGLSIAMTRPEASKFKVGVFYTPYNKTVLGYEGGRFPYYLHYGIHDYKRKPLNEWPAEGTVMFSEMPWLGTFNIESSSISNPAVPALSADLVLTHHAKWLHEMGTDFIIWDSSNHAWLENGYSDNSLGMVRDPLIKTLNQWSALRRRGINTPQIALWVPIPAVQRGTYFVNSLLEVIERPEYADLIFKHEGKPLLMIVSSDHPELLAQGPSNGRYYEPNPQLLNQLRSRYTIREMWANERPTGSDNWSYLQKCVDTGGNELTPYSKTSQAKCTQRSSPNPSGSKRIEQIPVTFAYARDHMSNRQSATPKHRGYTFLRQMETVFDNRNEVEIVTLSWFNTWAATQMTPICIPNHPTGLYNCIQQSGRNAYVSGTGLPVAARNGGATLGFTDDYDEEYGVAFEPGGSYGDYYMRLVNRSLKAIAENRNPMDLYDAETFAGRGRVTKLEGSTIQGWACLKGSSNSVLVSLRANGAEFAQTRASLDVRGLMPSEAAAIPVACDSSGSFHGFNLALTNAQFERIRGTRVTAAILADSEYFSDPEISGSFLVPTAPTPAPTPTATPRATPVIPVPTPVPTPMPTPVATPRATPVPSPKSGVIPAVTGVIDEVYVVAGVTNIRGWACVAGEANSIPVHLYVGGPAGAGELILGISANQPSEPAVAAACSSTGSAYRFKISVSTTLAPHKGKAIYIHGISGRDNIINNILHNSGSFFVP